MGPFVGLANVLIWVWSSRWASLSSGARGKGKHEVLCLLPQVAGCPSLGMLGGGGGEITAVCSSMCNLGMQSAEKIFIIARLSAEDNFNYSGISMDEEAL